MFALISCDVGHGGENISAVSSGPFDAVSMVDSSLPSFVIHVEILKVVIEIDGAGTQVPTEKGCMCGKDSGNVDVTFTTEGDRKASLPLVEVGNDGGGELSRNILERKFSAKYSKSQVNADITKEPSHEITKDDGFVGFVVIRRTRDACQVPEVALPLI